MYTIRVRPDGSTLDVTFSGEVPTSEALRAVSQGFALAEAGNIQRAMCDLSEVAAGPDLDTFSIIAASFVTRLLPGQRIAVLCSPAQLPMARRFSRFAEVGEELGVFTRLADADDWLRGVPEQRLSETALRHLGAPTATRDLPFEEPARRISRRAG